MNKLKKLTLLMAFALAIPHLSAAPFQPTAVMGSLCSQVTKIKKAIVERVQKIRKNATAKRIADFYPVTLAGIAIFIVIAAYARSRKPAPQNPGSHTGSNQGPVAGPHSNAENFTERPRPATSINANNDITIEFPQEQQAPNSPIESDRAISPGTASDSSSDPSGQTSDEDSAHNRSSVSSIIFTKNSIKTSDKPVTIPERPAFLDAFKDPEEDISKFTNLMPKHTHKLHPARQQQPAQTGKDTLSVSQMRMADMISSPEISPGGKKILGQRIRAVAKRQKEPNQTPPDITKTTRQQQADAVARRLLDLENQIYDPKTSPADQKRLNDQMHDIAQSARSHGVLKEDRQPQSQTSLDTTKTARQQQADAVERRLLELEAQTYGASPADQERLFEEMRAIAMRAIKTDGVLRPENEFSENEEFFDTPEITDEDEAFLRSQQTANNT
jgi:hypothetical protein